MWQHGGDIIAVKKEYPNVEFIDFSANINPLGQPKSVEQAINTSARLSLHYPDPFQRELKQAIGQFEGIDSNKIVCGNGAAEVIFKIAYHFKPKSALILAPTFAEYENALKQVGTTINYYFLKEENGFKVDKDFINYIKGHNIVILCNPNNPTGSLINKGIMTEIVGYCHKEKIALVVDECFMDFVLTEYSVKKYLADYPYLMIIKAFTKSFAIPGIRLGYGLVANSFLAENLEKVGSPWNVSTPAQLAGIAATTEVDFLEKSKQVVAIEREFLTQKLKLAGFSVYESVTNYLFFKSGIKALKTKLLPYGIVIRSCSNYIGLTNEFYRVAVKLREDNIRLIAAIEAIKCLE